MKVIEEKVDLEVLENKEKKMEIKIKETYFETSDYVRGNNVYSAQSLYKFAKEKGYPVRELLSIYQILLLSVIHFINS